jgi:hypothetical protein
MALFSILVYLLWVAATYLLEGRVNLMVRPTPLGRTLYVLIANVAIGIGLAGWILRLALVSGVATQEQLGFRSAWRTAAAVVIAALVGCGIFLVQRPASLNPIVVLNAFAQVLTVSIAEVLVCWAAIGITFQSLSRPYGRAISMFVGFVTADLFFGVYHFAHSAPFNQVHMVLFLMLIGLVTGLAYFLARDIYATILIQNVLGMIGVMQNIDVTFFSQPLYPLYVLMLISVLALVGFDILVLRRGSGSRRARAEGQTLSAKPST